MCGGIEATSVYVMFDCTAATAEEKAADAKKQKQALLTSYGAFNGETCGGATDDKNMAKITAPGKTVNSPSLSASLDECKIACWEGKGAESCHGFTYDSVMTKCTFHYDATGGEVKKEQGKDCYFKMVGR